MKHVEKLLVAVVLAAACSHSSAAEAVKGPCVAYPDGTTSGSVTIWWESARAGEGFVRYAAGRSGVKAVKSQSAGPRHEVKITGLKPGTPVRYEIGGSGVSDSGQFTTPDPGKKKFRFAVIGDPRAYDSATKALVPQLLAEKPDFMIATGDYVHKGKDGASANWKECFSVMRPLLKNVAFFPAIGDHEYGGDPEGSAFRENFVLPGNELWYSFDWGQAHFISLDVTWGRKVRQGTDQWKWLERDLAAGAGKRALTVSYFHLPIATCGHYSKDPDNTVRGRRLLPLFQKQRVGLVFCGHDHNYQRWHLGNVIQVVSGGFTVKRLYEINAEAQRKGQSQGLKLAQKVPHYVIVDVDGGKATARVMGQKMLMIDRWSCPPTGR